MRNLNGKLIIFVLALTVCMATSVFAFIPKVANNLKSSQMKKEVFKPVKDYEGLYEVSDMGRVKSIERFKNNYSKLQLVPEKIKSTQDNNHGYLQVYLCKNNNPKTITVHRLVAIAFIPNPENKRTINHINGIKTDNRVENLEWNTYSENHLHAYRTGLRTSAMIGKFGIKNPYHKSILQYSLNGKFIAEYGSGYEAMRKTGINNKCISRVCLGGRKKTGGFIWKFKTK